MNTIIQIIDGTPVMRNASGSEWVPCKSDDRWGLGTFKFRSVPLGPSLPYFMTEESLGTTFTVSDYEILENTGEKGVLRFTGVSGKLALTIVATMTDRSPAVTFEYNIDPIHPIFHRIYARIPFYAKSSVFLKYPYEDTLYADSPRWCIETDIARTPVVFGCETLEGKDYYLCAGYHLADNFNEGRFEIEPVDSPEAPFKLYSPFKGMARHIDLQCTTELELLRVDLEQARKDSLKTFRFIISVGENQYDCLKGYIDVNGYDKRPHIDYSVENAVEQLFSMYKNTPGYVSGKGYTQLIRTDTGRYDSTVPHGWYSRYFCPGPSCQLGYELYHHWMINKNASWARERAFEMADYLVTSQLPNGLFTHVNSDTAEMFADDASMLSESIAGYLYNIGDMNLGAFHLYMLYHDVLLEEGVDHVEWKKAAQKTIRTTMASMGEDGSLGRNYDANGNYDVQCAAVSEALMAMDYLYDDTGDEMARTCRDKVEEWVYNKYLKVNDLADNCMDGGAWIGNGKPPKDNDTMGLMGFICYCVQRHLKSGEERYLKMAKDVFVYQFVTVIPVEIPGFKHRTRGLVREQDFYSLFDLPMRVNDYLDCLPYLSKVTGDPFFAQFLSIILQTEMDYQEKVHPYRGFHIGLQCSYEGREPIDEIAEHNSVYIIRFAALFLKAVQSKLCYQYVGGKSWGVGRDYYIPFDTDLGEGLPYVLSCTGMIRDLNWDSKKKTIHIWGYDRSNEAVIMEISLNGTRLTPSDITIRTNEAELNGIDCYNAESNCLVFTASNRLAPSKKVDLLLK